MTVNRLSQYLLGPLLVFLLVAQSASPAWAQQDSPASDDPTPQEILENLEKEVKTPALHFKFPIELPDETSLEHDAVAVKIDPNDPNSLAEVKAELQQLKNEHPAENVEVQVTLIEESGKVDTQLEPLTELVESSLGIEVSEEEINRVALKRETLKSWEKKAKGYVEWMDRKVTIPGLTITNEAGQVEPYQLENAKIVAGVTRFKVNGGVAAYSVYITTTALPMEAVIAGYVGIGVISAAIAFGEHYNVKFVKSGTWYQQQLVKLGTRLKIAALNLENIEKLGKTYISPDAIMRWKYLEAGFLGFFLVVSAGVGVTPHLEVLAELSDFPWLVYLEHFITAIPIPVAIATGTQGGFDLLIMKLVEHLQRGIPHKYTDAEIADFKFKLYRLLQTKLFTAISLISTGLSVLTLTGFDSAAVVQVALGVGAWGTIFTLDKNSVVRKAYRSIKLTCSDWYGRAVRALSDGKINAR